MTHTISMPRYGATMQEGTISSWSVKEGDEVSKGDVIGEIEIEKLSNELLAEEGGIVIKLIAQVGDTLLCGEPILIMGMEGETFESSPSSTTGSQDQKLKTDQSALRMEPIAGNVETPPSQVRSNSDPTKITPKALQLANEYNVDLHLVVGTGLSGMITRDDVRMAIEAQNASSTGSNTSVSSILGEMNKMNQMQQKIAETMDKSLKSTAQTTLSMDLDASELVKAYAANKDAYNQRGVKLSYTVLLIKIVAMALVEHKGFRTIIDGSNLITGNKINVGIAIDIPDGLIVPNIKNAHQKSVFQIAKELTDLVNRAKTNSLILEDISEGVFTITNLGMYGIKYFTPILNPGQSGILGIGTIQDIPSIKDGGIFIKPVMNLSLTHDHRVVNGAPAARFLQTIQEIANHCDNLFKEQENI
jgi:pyruvate dehydrogenase E2 component (dihydrolipoamide acetyltransferase)